MSFFKRNRIQEPDTDEENDDGIDPELRLRTVRTAASAIAESIMSEQRAERRKSRHKGSMFFRKQAAAKKPQPAPPTDIPAPTRLPGTRRNIYINHPLSAMEVDHNGEPKVRYVRNKVRTTSACLSHISYISVLILVQNIPFLHLYPKTCTNNFDGESFSDSSSSPS
jgi:phospholipid-translocating ATPase